MGKLYTFIPMVNGCGAKFIASNIGFILPFMGKYGKIALVDLDLRNPFMLCNIALDDTTHNIDNIVSRLDSNSLNDELFLSNMIEVVKNKSILHILKGTKQFLKYNYFEESHISEIINYLKKHYDIIITAVSCMTDNAATPVALMEADEVIVVSRGTEACKQYSNVMYDTVSDYRSIPGLIKLVYNKFNESYYVDVKKYFPENSIEVLGLIGECKFAIDNKHLIDNYKWFSSGRMGDKGKFVRGIKSIADKLVSN